jgi:hypothetical protein
MDWGALLRAVCVGDGRPLSDMLSFADRDGDDDGNIDELTDADTVSYAEWSEDAERLVIDEGDALGRAEAESDGGGVPGAERLGAEETVALGSAEAETDADGVSGAERSADAERLGADESDALGRADAEIAPELVNDALILPEPERVISKVASIVGRPEALSEASLLGIEDALALPEL